MTEQLADYGVTCTGIDAAESEALAAALHRAVDPELGVDMLELGLVYQLVREPDAGYRLEMLLTTIGCPLTDYLEKILQHAMALVIGDAPVQVQFRMTPVWTMDRMSRACRMTLGV
ncbi:iron-sulfur cluster assembly protein [Lacticaseibacillus pabuli]|uniref:Iron-sulfur cluster assembly protein n=1 Tax=Lacticaseibacillus pabuli TaxID=3025672 RepID=A0ABY7WNG3_9LACO|nr:iron-sulfur cluster assembly protein [Lacticaseibacillus sp. KACC 23028]WDF81738.1 iron-sulfur cluster assembly protein [Lacticaseibacillus sp. KACC 23028]